MSDHIDRWPTVSVVIPVLNEEQHLRSSVEAILRQDYPGNFDVCLALGPSRDRTDDVARELTQRFANVRTVANLTGATPAGLNAAIRSTTGEIVVRVDGHAVLPDGYITRAVETLQRTGAVNVGGVQLSEGTTPFECAVAIALSTPFGMGGARFHTGGAEGPVDTVYLGVFRRTPSRPWDCSTNDSSATRTTNSISVCATRAAWCGSTHSLRCRTAPDPTFRASPASTSNTAPGNEPCCDCIRDRCVFDRSCHRLRSSRCWQIGRAHV